VQNLRIDREPQPLLGGERLGHLEPSQRQFRLVAIEMQHRVIEQGYLKPPFRTQPHSQPEE